MTDEAIALRGGLIFLTLFGVGPLLILLTRRAARGGGRERKESLWIRYATLIGIMAALLVSAYAGEGAFALLTAALVAGGLREFWPVARAQGLAVDPLSGVVAGAALVAGAHYFGIYGLAVAAAIAVGVLVPGRVLTAEGAPLPRIAGTLAGIGWVALLASFLVLIQQGSGGFGRFLFFIAVMQCSDVFALLGGLSIGGPKLAPSISPGKTWAGFACGLVAGVAAAAGFRFAVPELATGGAVLLGGVLALVGNVGGLTASAVKRAAGVKDFGTIFPGHGGVLDRFDTAFASAPFAWLGFELARRGAGS